MKIKNIGIIGGTHGIGASFAEHFEKKFKDQIEVFVSGRKTKITNKFIVQNCDLVIFSVPIFATEKVIKESLEFSHKNQIWADFTSVKQMPVNAMLQSKAQVCGLHPMFGPKKNIIGDKVVFCPERISAKNLDQVKDIFEDFDIIDSNPKEHDKAMQIVQGISHFSDLVTGGAIKNSKISSKKLIKFSSPSYKLKFEVLGRMFAQNPDLYAQIIIQNREAVETYFETLNSLKDLIDTNDNKGLAKEFQEIAEFLGKEFCETAFNNTNTFFTQYSISKSKKKKPAKQKKIDLAIFGEQFSHTDSASKLFSERKKAKLTGYFKNIFEVFELVESGDAETGIVPYENSIGGSVFETLEELFDRKVEIVSAVETKISQNLIGLPGTKLSEIKKITSHPQAISQSKKFLRTKCKNAKIEVEDSTAIAAQKVKSTNDKSFAAIGSKEIAKELGLEVIAPDTAGTDNKTRFIMIKKKAKKLTTKITSFAFWFSGDKSGNLSSVLNFFAYEKINLTKIDSRRSDKRHGNYLFFIDAEISRKKFEKLLPEFKKLCGGVKILGGY